ncbi:unnamed protein product [Orchesella dallaii]|uniref:Uncharacterized protein n=1 Tax=Orchesella dallaii TaxID=48710 RepID=A0ABP1RHC5_9HEXA
MAGLGLYMTWAHIEGNILQHFKTSSIEFVWDEGSSHFLETFALCVLLQCILIQFNSTKLLANPDYGIGFNNYRSVVWTYILKANAQTIYNQRYGNRDLIVFCDSTFPLNNWGFHGLQIQLKFSTSDIRHIPTAILSPTSCNAAVQIAAWERTINAVFTTTILLFVSREDESIYIGCFTCDKNIVQYSHPYGIDVNLYSITFLKLRRQMMQSIESLKIVWEDLHTNIQIDDETGTKHCLSISSYNMEPKSYEEVCEVYKLYFRHVNCSSFSGCANFHVFKVELKLDRQLGRFNIDILPAGQNELEFWYQVIFPKVNYFDAHLTAFLYPLQLNVWICVISILFGIGIWLIWMEGEGIEAVIFWEYGLLFEQDGDQMRKTKCRGKAMIIMCIFFGILLRNFYNSSLYSLMTTEQQPAGYPDKFEDALKRSDFDVISPASYFQEIYNFMHRWDDKPNRVSTLFKRVLYKSFFMDRQLYTETLQNASNGNDTKVIYYEYERNENEPESNFYVHWRDTEIQKRFIKLAVICEGDCRSKLNSALVVQKMTQRVVPEDRRISTVYKHWALGDYNFATFSFSKFLGLLVHSGLYGLALSRYKLVSDLRLLKRLNSNKISDMSNGSLFSYVVLAGKHEKIGEEATPTKIYAFTGTFIVAGILLLVGCAVLIGE